MKSQVLDISPELARAWLEANTFNRKVSPEIVNKYASDMEQGTWRLNHQGIAFDDEGVLVDGQHRLMAIVKSGVTIKAMVTWGSSRVGVDELRVRSTADVIKFGGLSDWIDSKKIPIAKQMIELFIRGNRARSYSTTDIVNFCERNKDAILFTSSLFNSNKKGISAAAVKATIATAYYHFPEKVLSDFVGILYSGILINENQNSAIRARDMIMSGEFGGGGADRIRTAKRLSRAIVAFNSQTPISRLAEPKEFPFLLPEDKR